MSIECVSRLYEMPEISRVLISHRILSLQSVTLPRFSQHQRRNRKLLQVSTSN